MRKLLNSELGRKSVEQFRNAKKSPFIIVLDNVRSMSNVGSIFRTADAFLAESIYLCGITGMPPHPEIRKTALGATESVARVLERVDIERISVAEALGIRAISARQWFYMAYSTTGDSLFEAMRKNPGYRGILAPKTLKMRYLEEDVPCSLIPMSSLGNMLRVPTPTIDSLIHMASVLNQKDYYSFGRTVERLGIANMNLRELRLLAIGEQSEKP